MVAGRLTDSDATAAAPGFSFDAAEALFELGSTSSFPDELLPSGSSGTTIPLGIGVLCAWTGVLAVEPVPALAPVDAVEPVPAGDPAPPPALGLVPPDGPVAPVGPEPVEVVLPPPGPVGAGWLGVSVFGSAGLSVLAGGSEVVVSSTGGAVLEVVRVEVFVSAAGGAGVDSAGAADSAGAVVAAGSGADGASVGWDCEDAASEESAPAPTAAFSHA